MPFTRDRNAFGKRARSDGRAPQERVWPPERLGFGHWNQGGEMGHRGQGALAKNQRTEQAVF